MVLEGGVVASLVWVVAPFEVLQEVVIAVVIIASSVGEAVETVKLVLVLQEAVMVLVINSFLVVVEVETVRWDLPE